MKGSVKHQILLMIKEVFVPCAKKIDRKNPKHPHYKLVSSYETMETYRKVWKNLLKYLKKHFNIKNADKIKSEHIAAYIEYKIESNSSKQYLKKISSAIAKLEVALTRFSKSHHKYQKKYDFSNRIDIVNKAISLNLVSDNYHNRAYNNPNFLISNLKNSMHKTAAKIQFEGGARLKGVALIKPEQLLGTKFDSVTNQLKGVIRTKEKGGREGEVLVSIDTYTELESYILKYNKFKINRQAYYKDIKQSAIISNEMQNSSHGLRWNFAKRRMFEYAKAGYKYEECLQHVSYEMKHNRANITKHYLCIRKMIFTKNDLTQMIKVNYLKINKKIYQEILLPTWTVLFLENIKNDSNLRKDISKLIRNINY
jgi:hypothetical protein